VLGLAGLVAVVAGWQSHGFGPLDYQVTMRQVIPSVTLITLALLGICNGFMLSILFLPTRRSAAVEDAVELSAAAATNVEPTAGKAP